MEMQSAEIVQAQSRELARPLRELMPLIKEEIEAGDQAGIEHYRRAGEMLLEAKAQVAHGDWRGWVSRNFHLTMRSAQRYMALADVPNATRASFSSMREALGSAGGGRGGGKGSWQQPVQQIAARVNVSALVLEHQTRQREKALLHTLSHQLIDIGYKVLASKLHPDKGGSSEAMARLNYVRKTLKGSL